MLVLTRTANETILIDGRITIKVLKVKGNRIRLGIDAPQDVRIRRGELSRQATVAALAGCLPVLRPRQPHNARTPEIMQDLPSHQ